MADPHIDLSKLHEAVRRLGDDDRVALLERAIDMMPKNRLARWLDGYVPLSDIVADAGTHTGLEEAVEAFREASLRGDYYDDSERSADGTPPMTDAWIEAAEHLFDRAAAATKEGLHDQSRKAFEGLFELVRKIHESDESIVFFSRAGGAWHVDLHWRDILPAYFGCLAATAGADEYADAVIEVVDEFVWYDRQWYLKHATSAADPAQTKALQER